MDTALNILVISFAVLLIAAVIYAFAKSIIRRLIESRSVRHQLTRHHKNPLISPLPFREWELAGTFNPAAIKDDDNRIHLLYRATGADGLSRVGHASTADGIHIDDRSQYPVYEPIPGVGIPETKTMTGPKEFNPSVYMSGGGWGGCEDPRAVRIGDRVYVTYVAFEGWNSVRIAITSITMKDLRRKRWNWRRPVLISKPNQVNKNWVLFPEKIHGKFALLHTITPHIMIEYVDSLDYMSKYIDSPRKHGPQPGRDGFFDNALRGAGPPPIRTELGWLLLYHATDRREPHKYKLGAMILDIDDPTRILYRSPTPILTPDMPYENDWKPGIVYASGAVILGENLMVYYGGGDKHVCVAETPLRSLLDWLVTYGTV